MFCSWCVNYFLLGFVFLLLQFVVLVVMVKFKFLVFRFLGCFVGLIFIVTLEFIEIQRYLLLTMFPCVWWDNYLEGCCQNFSVIYNFLIYLSSFVFFGQEQIRNIPDFCIKIYYLIHYLSEQLHLIIQWHSNKILLVWTVWIFFVNL